MVAAGDVPVARERRRWARGRAPARSAALRTASGTTMASQRSCCGRALAGAASRSRAHLRGLGIAVTLGAREDACPRAESVQSAPWRVRRGTPLPATARRHIRSRARRGACGDGRAWARILTGEGSGSRRLARDRAGDLDGAEQRLHAAFGGAAQLVRPDRGRPSDPPSDESLGKDRDRAGPAGRARLDPGRGGCASRGRPLPDHRQPPGVA